MMLTRPVLQKGQLFRLSRCCLAQSQAIVSRSSQEQQYMKPIIFTQTYKFTTSSISPSKIDSINPPEGMSSEELEKLLDDEMQKAQEAEDEKFVKNWRPGLRKRPLMTSYKEEDFLNEYEVNQWRPHLDKRCGALGIKLGMMPIWDEWGERHACTILYMHHNIVLKTFTENEDGYFGVQLGAGERKLKNVPKPLLGHFKKTNVAEHPPHIVREFRVTDEAYLPEPNTVLHARHFCPGQNVDVSSISKGKGFQGAMKRWNFGGQPASHGVSRSHRSLGSTGQCQDPGRVFKGKKMAGRMGGKRVTTQNLRVVKIDRGRDLLYIKGAVPGNKGNFVEIRDAVKKPLFGTELIEENRKFPPLPTHEIEDGIDGSGKAGFELFMPMNKEDPFDPTIVEVA